MAIIQTKVKNGEVRGIATENPNVSVFYSIPYAAPPVGKNRWRSPQPAKDWQGVLHANKLPPAPMQGRGGNAANRDSFQKIGEVDEYIPMSEDCLYLNIWTPANEPGEKLPVAVSIFGGGSVRGYSCRSIYDGIKFAQNGVILVTVNFRLNGFGFMQHPELTKEDPVGAGNYGMMDIVAAIKWLKSNIASFGGDPERISIFGHSSGGVFAGILTCSEMVRGDIFSAILQSGGGTGDNPKVWPLPIKQAEKFGERFFEFAGFSSLEQARAVPEDKLRDLLLDFERETNDTMRFKPCIDGFLLTNYLHVLQQQGKNHDIPYIIGCDGDETPPDRESKKPSSQEFVDQANAVYGKHAKEWIDIARGQDEKEFMYKTRAYYKHSAVEAFGIVQNKNGRKDKTFCYVFDKPAPGSTMGTTHGNLIAYQFVTLNHGQIPFNGEDYDIAITFNKYFSNFFTYGNPNGKGELLPWKPYSQDCPMAMGFLKPGMRSTIKNDVTEFLTSFHTGLLGNSE